MITNGLLLLAAWAVAGAETPPPPSPSPSSVYATIVPERSVMVLGTDHELALVIEIHGNGGAALRPERAVASVGTIQEIVAAGPDRFTTRYLAPATRFPQVAILVIDFVGAGQHLRAVTRLALHAATEMPFRTNPNASVTLRVAGKAFGPVRADEQGHVTIPIVVPPGVREGTARAVDRSGSTRETSVDLQSTPFNRLLIVAAPAAEVGSFVETSVFAVDGGGAPLPAGRIALTVSDGMVHPLGSGIPGEERFLVEAPRRLAAGPIRLVAATTPAGAGKTPTGAGKTPAGDKKSDPSPARAELVVALVPGPPQRLILIASPDRLIIGERSGTTVTIAARDRLDNPTPCTGAVALVDHLPAPIRLSRTGEGIIRIASPDRDNGRRDLEVDVSAGAAYASTRVRLISGPAVRLSATPSVPHLIADGHHSADLRVDAYDAHGTPAPVPDLHWQAPGGKIGPVQSPREGTYLAQFTPRRARDPHVEVVEISAGPPLSATATLTVEPPRARLGLTARVGLFSNLGSMAGPAAAVEALTGLPGHAAWAAGVEVSYLNDDLTTGGGDDGAPAVHLEIDQVPILAVVRYRLPLAIAAAVNLGAGAGLSLARVALNPVPNNDATAVKGTARAPAFEVRGEVAFPLAPGELVVGAHYLWIDFGRTSEGDEIHGNSAGLVSDLGFRMTW